MSNGGGGQGGDDKNAMQILWIIFGIFALGFVIWYFLGDELKQIFIFIKLWELKIFHYIVSALHITPLIDHITPALMLAENLTPHYITQESAIKIATVSGEYVRFPVIIFIVICGYYLYGKNIKVKYRKRYDMWSLLRQEKSLWPQVQVVDGLGLVDTPLDKGPWAMAMPPMLFAKKHKLLEVGHVEGTGHGAHAKFEARVIKSKAEKIFASQLGRPWRGPNHMLPHRKALLAVFMARGCRDTAIARQIISNLNYSIGAGKTPNYDFVDAMIKKHSSARPVKDIFTHHAYETTVITSMLLFAREDGVLACADFLWLKPLDRRFWYTLNNVGRQTPFVEAAGIHAHWLAEKSLGKKMTVPYIKQAVSAFQGAIQDIIYVPTPEEKDELLKKASGGN